MRDGKLRYVAYLINFSGDPEIGYKKPEIGAEEEYFARQQPMGVTFPAVDAPHFVVNREAMSLGLFQEPDDPIFDLTLYGVLRTRLVMT